MRSGYFRVWMAVMVLALAAAAIPSAVQAAEGEKLVQAPPASFGEPFPAHAFRNLNHGPGGAEQVDLASVLGKKPVLYSYFIAKNQRAEQIFREVQDLVDEIGADRIALYGIAVPRPGLDEPVIRERAAALKIHVPILDDEGFRLGQQLVVRRVPHISIVDREGILRLANAGSLLQNLEYKMDVGRAVRRLAETGKIGTYGYLPDYSPSVEMIGRIAPDFKAPSISNGSLQQWSGLYSKNSINLLIFWSVNCPHCRKALPEYSRWHREHRDKANIITVARVNSQAERIRTREFLASQKVDFVTVEDQDMVLSSLYKVTATPTIFVVGPDGKVDSLLSPSAREFGEKVEAKRAQLLQ